MASWGMCFAQLLLFPCLGLRATNTLRCCLFVLRNAGYIPHSSDAAFWSCALHAKMLDGLISLQVHRTKICHQAILASSVITCIFHGGSSWHLDCPETEVAAVVPFLLHLLQSLHIGSKPYNLISGRFRKHSAASKKSKDRWSMFLKLFFTLWHSQNSIYKTLAQFSLHIPVYVNVITQVLKKSEVAPSSFLFLIWAWSRSSNAILNHWTLILKACTFYNWKMVVTLPRGTKTKQVCLLHSFHLTYGWWTERVSAAWAAGP